MRHYVPALNAFSLPDHIGKFSTIGIPGQCWSLLDDLENSELQDNTLHVHSGHSLGGGVGWRRFKNKIDLFHPVPLQTVENQDVGRRVLIVFV